jgi:hypothetical protein
MCIHRVANSNESQHSSCFKTKIILFHYSKKEYLTWPQSVVALCKEHNSKQTVCENMMFYNCMKFQPSMSHPFL